MSCTFPQVTVGKQSKSSKKSKPAQGNKGEQLTTNDEEIKLGNIVALRLQKYKLDIPQIGRVVELSDMDVTVEWWHGTYSSVWIH